MVFLRLLLTIVFTAVRDDADGHGRIRLIQFLIAAQHVSDAAMRSVLHGAAVSDAPLALL